MRHGWMVSASLLAACSFQGPKLDNTPSDGGRLDGLHDTPTDDTSIDGSRPDAPTLPAGCFGSRGSGNFYICDPGGAPQTALPLMTGAGNKFLTTGCIGGHLVSLAGQQVCLLSGAGVTVADFSVYGDAVPLVIASSTDLTVSGLLDVSTSSGAHHGPGSSGNPSGCAGGTLDGGGDPGGAGGAAGGSLGSLGGNGGDGKGAQGHGAAAVATPAPLGLHAGCPGGAGGNSNGNGGGNPGWGGGAIWLVAYGTITISGTINASGERGYHGTGGHGNAGAGGSGAGSGGMIVLDAATLNVTGTGVLLANGGGGGGGGDGSNDGNDGSNPATPTAPATGGGGSGSAGDGGNGAAASAAATKGGTTTSTMCGGGGGGGGLGLIEVISGGVPGHGANISPDARPAP